MSISGSRISVSSHPSCVRDLLLVEFPCCHDVPYVRFVLRLLRQETQPPPGQRASHESGPIADWHEHSARRSDDLPQFTRGDPVLAGVPQPGPGEVVATPHLPSVARLKYVASVLSNGQMCRPRHHPLTSQGTDVPLTPSCCQPLAAVSFSCLLYTSDAADEEDSVDLG